MRRDNSFCAGSQTHAVHGSHTHISFCTGSQTLTLCMDHTHTHTRTSFCAGSQTHAVHGSHKHTHTHTHTHTHKLLCGQSNPHAVHGSRIKVKPVACFLCWDWSGGAVCVWLWNLCCPTCASSLHLAPCSNASCPVNNTKNGWKSMFNSKYIIVCLTVYI